jgi:hypothetical protein
MADITKDQITEHMCNNTQETKALKALEKMPSNKQLDKTAETHKGRYMKLKDSGLIKLFNIIRFEGSSDKRNYVSYHCMKSA